MNGRCGNSKQSSPSTSNTPASTSMRMTFLVLGALHSPPPVPPLFPLVPLFPLFPTSLNAGMLRRVQEEFSLCMFISGRKRRMLPSTARYAFMPSKQPMP